MESEDSMHNPETELSDEFLLTASSEEIARKVAPDEETIQKLIPFIQREKDKLEKTKQRKGGIVPKSMERLVAKSLRILFNHPEIYQNYKE